MPSLQRNYGSFAIALAVIAVIAWWASAKLAMPAVEAHVGDGRFENHSARFPFRQLGVPIAGYTIDFEEFDLGDAFEASYKIEKLPEIDKPIGIYLCVVDPEHKFWTDMSRAVLNAKLDISVVDGHGKAICHISQPLAKMTWAYPEGGADTYGVYNLDQSFFDPRRNNQYQIRVQYRPDPRLIGLRGFVHIRCGGSI